MTIRNSTKPIIKAIPSLSACDAAKLMDQRNIGSLVVEEHGKTVGIVTERDMLKKVVALGLDPKNTMVRDIMTSPVISVEISTSLVEASDLMEKKRIRHLIVTDNGKTVGLVSIRDIAEGLRYRVASSILGHRK